MNRNRCEREIKVTEALRTSVWTAELKDHIAACAACEEALRVAGSLLQYASELRVEIAAESEVGSVEAIWRRAQSEWQAVALKRAMRPLLFMRGLSVGSLLALALWLLRGVSRLDYMEYRGWMHGWAGMGAATAAVGGGIAMACIGMGALYLLREEKRRGILGGA